MQALAQSFRDCICAAAGSASGTNEMDKFIGIKVVQDPCQKITECF